MNDIPVCSHYISQNWINCILRHFFIKHIIPMYMREKSLFVSRSLVGWKIFRVIWKLVGWRRREKHAIWMHRTVSQKTLRRHVGPLRASHQFASVVVKLSGNWLDIAPTRLISDLVTVIILDSLPPISIQSHRLILKQQMHHPAKSKHPKLYLCCFYFFR